MTCKRIVTVSILIVSVLALWARGFSQNPEQSLDFSCSTFHAFLTEKELVGIYGAENVTRGPVFGTDDGPSDGTILFANQNDKRIEIKWYDNIKMEGPEWIRARATRSRWRTPNGISIGDDLLSIEKRNGWPFRLAGFTSEGNAGRLLDWNTGRLSNTLNCDLRMTFQPSPGKPETLIRQVTHLVSVSSGHPAMQQINPSVVELSITHPKRRSPENPADAILDVLVFGLHMPIDPAAYGPDLRAEIQKYLRRAQAYVPRRLPASPGMEMFYTALISYETRLVAQSDDAAAPELAQSYVTKLRPCYEWEGFHDCPERDAIFADAYQTANPNGPFRDYLPLLSAHRWLCTAEAYVYENNFMEGMRSRTRYEQRLAIARQSSAPLIRAAADRLASRKQCIAK